MFVFSLLLEIKPFPERNDNLMKERDDEMRIYASGSIGEYIKDKCVKTKPETIIDPTESHIDWCSAPNKTKDDNPWFIINKKNKAINVKGYALRTGCCVFDCCCDDGRYIACCCALYSWSLQVSHDNVTWKEIHRVEKDKQLYNCMNRVFDLSPTNEYYEYVKLVQTEPWPGCLLCMCINKFELYGKLRNSIGSGEFDDGENDESVSIIGKVSKNYA